MINILKDFILYLNIFFKDQFFNKVAYGLRLILKGNDCERLGCNSDEMKL